jgi:hypothetical protein
MQSIFWCSHHTSWGNYHSGRSKNQSLSGKMMHPAGCYQGTLTRLKEAVHCKRPRWLSQGALQLHDDARPHIARPTLNLLNIWHWEILPYSPDLAPSDFHLLPKLKKHLWGLWLQTDEDAQENASFYHQSFDSLTYCCDKCLNRYGNYVKKYIAYVRIPNPCVIYYNLFIFQIKKCGTLLSDSASYTYTCKYTYIVLPMNVPWLSSVVWWLACLPRDQRLQVLVQPRMLDFYRW